MSQKACWLCQHKSRKLVHHPREAPLEGIDLCEDQQACAQSYEARAISASLARRTSRPPPPPMIDRRSLSAGRDD